tara:strand:- start:11228 stop:11521 length:294 start_codon:yes stop_codon:yes gene_type:complete
MKNEICGKPILFTKEFKNDGEDFSGIGGARDFLKEKGFSIGSMQRDAPMGVSKEYEYIAKWRNLSSDDRLQLDGTITFTDGGPRNGTATINLNVEVE